MSLVEEKQKIEWKMKTELTLKPILLKNKSKPCRIMIFLFVSFHISSSKNQVKKYSIMINVENISERNDTLTQIS